MIRCGNVSGDAWIDILVTRPPKHLLSIPLPRAFSAFGFHSNLHMQSSKLSAILLYSILYSTVFVLVLDIKFSNDAATAYPMSDPEFHPKPTTRAPCDSNSL